MTQELDTRVGILNSFLAAPPGHTSKKGEKKVREIERVLGPTGQIHKQALNADPLFYAHLAPWYFSNGEVRDHKVLFVSHLLTAPAEMTELREAGWALLQQLAPFEVARVVDYCKRAENKAPRQLKSAVEYYLRTIEKNPKRFEGAVLQSRKDMKHLYSTLRIKPGSIAQSILFDGNAPEGTQVAALKRLAESIDPHEQAEIILESNINYTTAVGAISKMTPAILVVLIDKMTPQQVINSLGSLKERGAMDDPDVRQLVNAKIRAAEKDTRVSTMKTQQAMNNVDLDEETRNVLTQTTDNRLSAKDRITRSTALLVDRSQSMDVAIDVAKQLSALIAQAIDAPFYVYVFDTVAAEVTPPATNTESAWANAFRYVRAGGMTSIGAGVAALERAGRVVEQFVLVTDEQENSSPLFRDAYERYAERFGVRPNVVDLVVSRGYASDYRFRSSVESVAPEATRIVYSGDYYSLPNLLPILSAPGRAELVERIMQVPLPRRTVTRIPVAV